MSQKEAILDWLKSGRTITQREALAQFGCWRLASRISDLRREGHPIVTVNKKVNDRFGNIVRIAQYHYKAQTRRTQ
jgi:hypothetical protein